MLFKKEHWELLFCCGFFHCCYISIFIFLVIIVAEISQISQITCNSFLLLIIFLGYLVKNLYEQGVYA